MQDISGQLLCSKNYIVRLAESDEDLRAAQSLRYEVFNLELGEGLASSHEDERDSDKYDQQCAHLLVVTRDTDEVIGTYRMQTYTKAQEHHGFYTSDIFHLSHLPDDILGQSVEVGRACIHKEHRNGRVLFLLWRGIAEYMELTDSRYLFGCCSITSTDPREGWVVMDYLRNNELLHPEYRIDPKPDYICPEQKRDQDAWKEVELPQLFQLYIDIGAKTLSKPALDQEFQTIDFLIIVDTGELDERSKALFFK